MKDKWFTDLKNKIEGHEDDPPDGLWESIESNLFPEEENNIFPLMADPVSQEENSFDNNKKVKRLVSVLSIAASVALLVSVIYFYDTKDNIKDQNAIAKTKKPKSRGPESAVGVENPLIFSFNVDKDILDLENMNDNQKMGSYLQKTDVVKDLHDQLIANISIEGKELPTVNLSAFNTTLGNLINPDFTKKIFIPSLPADKRVSDSILISSAVDRNSLAANDLKKDKRVNKNNERWAIGVISGQPASNSSQQLDGYAMMNGSNIDIPVGSGPETGDDPLSEIVAGNTNEYVKTDIRHRQPVRLGVSVSYKLNDKWSVTTGLSYSKLASDVFSGTPANMIKGEQSVKYVGIPVQINYNIWQKGNLSTYASAGAQVEKSISGKMKTDYIVNHEVRETTTEKLKVNSLQASVNVGVGVQYKVFKNFGVYFEPGVRYNFKDGSDIRTIYNEKPVNVNLEFGLRYSIR